MVIQSLINCCRKIKLTEYPGLRYRGLSQVGWRGLMLDVGRHFSSMKSNDAMAIYQHLTCTSWMIMAGLNKYPCPPACVWLEPGEWNEVLWRSRTCKEGETATYGGFYHKIRSKTLYDMHICHITILPGRRTGITPRMHTWTFLYAWNQYMSIQEQQ